MARKKQSRVAPSKRAASGQQEPRGGVKRPRTTNLHPLRRLDIFVCGSGDCGELGLGPKTWKGKAPNIAKFPRINHLLDSHGIGISQVAVGGMHCAALTYNSKVLTWGVNDDGALGRDSVMVEDEDGSDADEFGLDPGESIPTPIPPKSFSDSPLRFSQLTANDCATFALTDDGFVYGWGTFKGADGTIGFSKEGLKNITKLAAAGNHALALDQDRRVWAWGCGEQSQLGRRIVPRRRLDSLVPYRHGLKDIVNLSCGLFHSFAINSKGRVYAWGLNNYGQTGIQDGAGEPDSLISKPTLVTSLRNFWITEISGGNHHSLACTKEGDLLAWGRCDDNQLGLSIERLPKNQLVFDDRQQPRILLVPSKVPGLRVTSAAAGIDNSIAILKNGQAMSWGFSENYRTGLATEKSVAQATIVKSEDIEGRVIVFAACGGQFSVLASVALPTNNVSLN